MALYKTLADTYPKNPKREYMSKYTENIIQQRKEARLEEPQDIEKIKELTKQIRKSKKTDKKKRR